MTRLNYYCCSHRYLRDGCGNHGGDAGNVACCMTGKENHGEDRRSLMNVGISRTIRLQRGRTRITETRKGFFT